MKSRESAAERPVWRKLVRTSHRWAVILAGGDGRRLLPLTRRITGEDTPKQFCSLGGETLLNQARKRVSRVVPRDQTFLMLTRTHERFYKRQITDTPASSLIVQPYNHGTAPAIAYSLMRLQDQDPSGIVAFFPSDHHFENGPAFARNLELAFAQAESDRDRVVLLGITPDQPEEAYGWIEPGAALSGPGSVCEVRRFWEKPSRKIASRLMRRGCLWNSFVMIGGISAFLGLMRDTLPTLVSSLEAMRAEAVPGKEDEGLSNLYASIPATNFSEDVLAAKPSALAVLRADGLGWSDLGEPQRVLSIFGDDTPLLGQGLGQAAPASA